MRRQPPAELLGELDAHRLLSFDAIRLAQRRDVEVAVSPRRTRARACRRRRCARRTSCSSAPSARIVARIGAGVRRGREDAHGNAAPRRRRRRAPRRRCPPSARRGPARRVPRARVTAALMPRALNDAVGFSPSSFTQSRATPISRASAGSSSSGVAPSPSDTGVSPSRSGSTARVAPHVPARRDRVARGPWRIVANEQRLPAAGQTEAQRVAALRVRRTPSIRGARCSRDSVGGGSASSARRCDSRGVAGCGRVGAYCAQRIEDALRALHARSPAARRSARASRRGRPAGCRMPRAAAAASTSPTPGMRSSSDVIVRTVRRLRWKVIAKRCASSRACWSMRSAGERRGRRSDSRAAEHEDLLLALGEADDRQRAEPERLAALRARR